MTRVFTFARRAIRLRGLLLPLVVGSLAGCGASEAPTYTAGVPDGQGLDSTTPPVPPPDTVAGDSTPAGGTDSVAPPPDSLGLPPARGNYSGLPFGPFGLPPALYGAGFSGTMRALPPEYLLSVLAAARQGGIRVVVRFVGGPRLYRNNDGSFSFAKWKQRVDRFRELDFSSYIEDGTIIGHFILDEPHDKSNWGGTLVSPETVDEMARYSKQLWPSMPTIVRGWPAYLKGYKYEYLDAAWAQYSNRFGPIESFITSNVQDAKSAGLSLVVGLNLLDGGSKASGIPGRRSGTYAMSASQVKSWGGALLSDPFICAFISWKYAAAYFSRPDIESALSELSQKARDLPKKSCGR